MRVVLFLIFKEFKFQFNQLCPKTTELHPTNSFSLEFSMIVIIHGIYENTIV